MAKDGINFPVPKFFPGFDRFRPFEFLSLELLNQIYTIILPYLRREIVLEVFSSISRSVREIRLFLCTDPVEGHLIYPRSEEHTSELQSRFDLVCRLLLEKN